MSTAWGKIGAWAAEAERAEAEEKEQAAAEAAAAAVAAASGVDSKSFPSLKDSANIKQTKKKTKMSWQEFTMQGSYGSRRDSAYDQKGLTPDEMLRLPTGPKERSPDEMQPGRLGGGFSSYGSRSGGPPGRMRDRDADGDNSWGGNRRSYGGFDDERRAHPPRASDYDQPSRADEADNWALMKKSLPSHDSGRPNRYSSLGGGMGTGGFSPADEVDNWAVGKKPMPPLRSSNFSSGFRDYGQEPDRWTRGGTGDGDRERPRLILNPPRSERVVVVEPVKTNKPSPFGAARPREDVLSEKGLDWKKLDLEIDSKKTSRPPSSQSSRPGSAQSSRSEGPALQGMEVAVKPKPKVNPFGDAKPREVLLEEKGLDWRKIDLELEHRSVVRPETEAEKKLREEIEHLKKELEKESASNADKESQQGSGNEQINLNDLILHKQRDLELLVCELDDKVRFGQRPTERPGSGAGLVAGFPERLPLLPRAFEESRGGESMERPRSRGYESMERPRSRGFESMERPRSRGYESMERPQSRGSEFMERPQSRGSEFMERPRSKGAEFMERPQSRGTGDAWTRHGDDRRTFHGSRERGFLGSRDMDRQRLRERW